MTTLGAIWLAWRRGTYYQGQMEAARLKQLRPRLAAVIERKHKAR